MLVILAAVLAVTDPATPPPASTIVVNAVPPPDKRAADRKMICHEWDYPGTRLLTRRVCGTKADWLAYEQNVRSDMSRMATIAAGF